MIIRPGERIPTDGIVIDGSSSIDESAVTGESIPVDKKKNDQVIGATINKSGLLRVKAIKWDKILCFPKSLNLWKKIGQEKLRFKE